MIPQLKPEIYLLIAKHVKQPFPVHHGAHAEVQEAIEIEQETLLNLMKVSKVSDAPLFDRLN
jgi:hypothetical protein